MLTRHTTILTVLAAALAGGDGLVAQTLPPPKPVAKEVPVELEVWESPDKAVSLSFPKGWKAPEKPRPGTAFVAVNPEEPGANMRPDAVAFRSTTSNAAPTGKFAFDPWAKAMKKTVAARVKEFKLQSDSTGAVAGVQALRMVYDGKDEDGLRARTVEWIFVKGNGTYELAFTYDPTRQEKMQPIVLAVTRSLTIGKPGGESPAVAKAPAAKPVAAQTLPSNAVLYESAEHGLRLAYPSTWTARKTPDPGTLLFLLPEGERKAQPRTILVTVEAVEADAKPVLKDQVDAAVSALKAVALPDAKVIDAADVKVAGERGRRAVVGGHDPDKGEVRAMFLLFQHANRTVTISGRAAAADFDSLKEAFDAIASSIELVTPGPKRAK